MKILVTGGAGFIGSHIQDKYIELGHDVTVIDNFSTGKRDYLNSAGKLIEGDITDYDLVRSVFENGEFDLVNHHAAQINVRYSFDDPIKDCSINVIGTLNVLKSMIDFGVKKIIFASTGGAIYGSPEEIPVNEKTQLDPGSPYAISKLTCENYIKNLSDLYGIGYTIFRYANIFGPRQIAKGEAGVVAIFMERMLDGLPPVIFGSGDNTRDYVFVSDVANANALALDKVENGIYNIGTGIETDVHEVYAAISEVFNGGAPDKEFGPSVPEVGRIALDASRARNELGWRPEVGFVEGVKLAAKFYGIG